MDRHDEWVAVSKCHHHQPDSHKHDQMVPPDSILAFSSVDGNGSSPAYLYYLCCLQSLHVESRGNLECGHSDTGYTRLGLVPPGEMRHVDTVLLQRIAGGDDVL